MNLDDPSGSRGVRRERRALGARFAVFGLVLAFVPGAGCSSGDDDAPAGVFQAGGTAGSGGSAQSGNGGRAGAGGTRASGGTSGDGSGADSGESNGGADAGAGNDTGGADDSGGTGNSGGTSAGAAGDPSGGVGGGSSGSGGRPITDELCGDGDDNDGDGYGDCDDDDCADACASCDSAELIDDPSELAVSNLDRPAGPPSDCVATGPALIYEVIADTTGVLEAEASSTLLLRTSILEGCDDETVLACASKHASARVTAGDRRFVRIAGANPQDVGDISVTVHTRPADVCGDGYVDPPEACDDGGRASGDGCDLDCALELSESEPNQDRDSADAWADPFVGEITPAGDEDFVVVDVDTGGTLVAETLDLGDGACEDERLDSVLELFDASGDPLGEDDDGGVGYCSRITRPYSEAGRYYLRVTALGAGETPVFPYRIAVRVE